MAKLQALGLSVYASRAYIALLNLGTAEARAVSECASIPTAKVYGTLEQLQQRGLAQVTAGKPRKYAPVPMEQFLEAQLAEREERLANLRSHKDELIRLFPILGSADLPARSRMLAVLGERNVLTRFREASQRAEREIVILCTPELASTESPLARPLAQARRRGVDVRWVEDDRPAHAEDASAGRVAIAAFDDREALFLKLWSQGKPSARSRASAFHAKDPAFVASLQTLLVFRWQERTLETAARDHLAMHLREGRHVDVLLCGASRADALLRQALAEHAPEARVLVPHDASAQPPTLPGRVELRTADLEGSASFALLGGSSAILSPSTLGATDGPLAATADPAIVRALEEWFESRWANAAVIRAPGALEARAVGDPGEQLVGN